MKKATRIRYTELNGKLTSSPMFALTEMVTAVIDMTKSKVCIVNDQNTIVFTKDVKTKQKAMKEAKRALKELGVQFYDEVRQNRELLKEVTNETSTDS